MLGVTASMSPCQNHYTLY